jgi:hypothetical protein
VITAPSPSWANTATPADMMQETRKAFADLVLGINNSFNNPIFTGNTSIGGNAIFQGTIKSLSDYVLGTIYVSQTGTITSLTNALAMTANSSYGTLAHATALYLNAPAVLNGTTANYGFQESIVSSNGKWTAWLLGSLNGAVYPTATSIGGFTIGGNFSGGNGETNFFNTYFSASEAFRFSQQTAATSQTDIVSLSKGAVNLYQVTTISPNTQFGLIINSGGYWAGLALKSATWNKFIDVNSSTGNLEFVNSANSGVIAYLTDTGFLSVAGATIVQALTVNGNAGNTTGVWVNNSDDRIKQNITDVTDATDKVIALASAIKHYEFIDEVGLPGERTGPIAQLVQAAGFEGHVTSGQPMQRAVAEKMGWEWGEYGVLTKEGEEILYVENNFVPYLIVAVKELAGRVSALENK